jgi:hypothetical protein
MNNVLYTSDSYEKTLDKFLQLIKEYKHQGGDLPVDINTEYLQYAIVKNDDNYIDVEYLFLSTQDIINREELYQLIQILPGVRTGKGIA